jgi:hypothetical protein
VSAEPDLAIDFLRRRLAVAILARDSITAARLIAELDKLLNGEAAR